MKETLILLHGALGTQNQFRLLKQELIPSFHVLTFDFDGHGNKPTTEAFTMDLFVSNLIVFLDQNEIQKTHIFGYSMGGFVALMAALRIPNRIDKIVSLGTKFNWDPISTAKEIAMLNPEKIEAKVPHFAQKLQTEHPGQHWKELLTKTGHLMEGLSAKNKFNEQQISTLAHNISIGIGMQDNMVTLQESEHIANLLANGSLHVLPDVVHPIEKNDPTQLKDFITESITKLA